MKRLIFPYVFAAFLAGCDAADRVATASAPVQATNPPVVPTSATPTAPDAPSESTPPTRAATVPPLPPQTGPAAEQPSVVPVAPPQPPPELPPAVQEVVRLAQTTLGEPVLISYIESIREPFTLNVDQVIYLSDLGLGSPAISALLRKAGASGPVSSPTQTVIVQTSDVAGLATGAEAVVEVAEPAGPRANVILTNYLASTGSGLSGGIPGAPVPAAPAPVYGSPQPGPMTPANVAAQQVVVQQPVSYNTFHESLSPYGNWVQLEPYGWCWQPTVVTVNPNWRPYCDGGQWLWTDVGWYWQSSYSWGWAPFHYGRWHRNTRVGWVWTPGADWGPAWVSWRWTDAHCGWAPLPPECRWSAGIGFSWFSGNTAVSVGFGLWDDCWYATSWNRFCDPGLPRWGLQRHQVTPFVRNSRIAVGGDNSVNIVGNNNTVIVNNGIPRDQVQRHTRDEIRKHAIADAPNPAAAARAAGGISPARPQVASYRPTINRETATPAVTPPSTILARQEARKTGTSPSLGSAAVPSRPGATAPTAPILGGAAPARTPTPATPAPGQTFIPARPGSSPAPVTSTAPRPIPGGNLAPSRPNPSTVPPRPGTSPNPSPTPSRPGSTVGTTPMPGSDLGTSRNLAPARGSYPSAPANQNAPLAAPLYSQPAYNNPAARPSINSAPAYRQNNAPVQQVPNNRSEIRRSDLTPSTPAPAPAQAQAPSRPAYNTPNQFAPANRYSPPTRPNNPAATTPMNRPSVQPMTAPTPVQTPSRTFSAPPPTPAAPSYNPPRPVPTRATPAPSAPAPAPRSQPSPQAPREGPRGKAQDR